MRQETHTRTRTTPELLTDVFAAASKTTKFESSNAMLIVVMEIIRCQLEIYRINRTDAVMLLNEHVGTQKKNKAKSEFIQRNNSEGVGGLVSRSGGSCTHHHLRAGISSVSRELFLTHSPTFALIHSFIHSLFDWHYPHPQSTNIEFENKIKHCAVIHCLSWHSRLLFSSHCHSVIFPGGLPNNNKNNNRLPINNQPATHSLRDISTHRHTHAPIKYHYHHCCRWKIAKPIDTSREKWTKNEINVGDRYRQIDTFMCASDGSTGWARESERDRRRRLLITYNLHAIPSDLMAVVIQSLSDTQLSILTFAFWMRMSDKRIHIESCLLFIHSGVPLTGQMLHRMSSTPNFCQKYYENSEIPFTRNFSHRKALPLVLSSFAAGCTLMKCVYARVAVCVFEQRHLTISTKISIMRIVGGKSLRYSNWNTE